jgi:integrase
VIDDPEGYSNTIESINAISRELRRRSEGKFFDEPMPHKITLNYAAKKYMEEMASEGRPKKTRSKVKNAAKRFLEFRELPDMELERISPKLLKQYINQARIENRAESTFKNDIHYLGSVFNWAKQEGWLENLPNPFRDLRITGLRSKTKRWPFSKEMLIRMKKMPEVEEDPDIRKLFWISYFTGMRISEVFSAKYKTVDGVLCFDVASEGGKTASARRIIPLHSWLIEFLDKPKDGDTVQFKATSATNLGKRFGRFKDRVLEDMGQGSGKRHYGHHSFRHGFITTLMAAGYHEVEIADLTGHKKSNIGRTEAGKTYFHRQDIGKLVKMIQSIAC